jgi:protease-4
VATVAHIKLSGGLDEAPVADDPLFGASGENFKTKLDRIKKAKDDSSISGLVLQLNDLSIGYEKVDELRRAIADFRKAGKKAFAYMDSGSTKEYLVAAACDEVCLPESGTLMLTGLRAEVMFYKDLFEKIGVKADMLQMGAYKGAAEPYSRSSMSKEVRSQYELVLDGFYEQCIVSAIVKSRPKQKWTAEQVKKIIDEGPYCAKAAAAAGLIDKVAYLESYQDSLTTNLDAEKIKVVKNYEMASNKDLDLSDPFAIFKLFAPRKPTSSNKPKIAVIFATGMITTGKSQDAPLLGKTLGSTTLVEAIRQAEQDKTVKAIVLRVDSPGGSALASDLIWNELQKSKKPVIASMGDVAASGGYYISMAAQKIFAEPGTLTGSIGVLGGKLSLGGLEEKIGLHTDVISRGANAGVLSTTTPFTDSERKAMTALMQDVYDQFVDKALQGRKKAGVEMTREDLLNVAGGRIWTGQQAKEKGLIDELGTLGDTIAYAKKCAGMGDNTDPELLLLPKAPNFLDMLLDLQGDSKDSRASLSGLQALPLLREFPELAAKLAPVMGLLQLRNEPVWVVMPYPLEIH